MVVSDSLLVYIAQEICSHPQPNDAKVLCYKLIVDLLYSFSNFSFYFGHLSAVVKCHKSGRLTGDLMLEW